MAVGEAGWPVVKLCIVGVTVGMAGWPVVRLCSVGQAGFSPGVSLCSMLIFFMWCWCGDVVWLGVLMCADYLLSFSICAGIGC